VPLRQRLRRSSSVAPDDPYTLLVALDAQVTSILWEGCFFYHTTDGASTVHAVV